MAAGVVCTRQLRPIRPPPLALLRLKKMVVGAYLAS
jgi:hypothetical protein